MVDVLLTMNEAACNSGPCKFCCVASKTRLQLISEKKHD